MPRAFIYSSQVSPKLQTEGLDGLEDDLDEFLGPAGEATGSGIGATGWNMDLDLVPGVDARDWLDPLIAYLRRWGLSDDTYVVIPAGDGESEGRHLRVFPD
jgi:hypothetical protein